MYSSSPTSMAANSLHAEQLLEAAVDARVVGVHVDRALLEQRARSAR